MPGDAGGGGVERVLESAEEFIRLRYSEDPDDYYRAAHEQASTEVWLDVIQGYPDARFWVAQNKTVPADVLSVLARDPDLASGAWSPGRTSSLRICLPSSRTTMTGQSGWRSLSTRELRLRFFGSSRRTNGMRSAKQPENEWLASRHRIADASPRR